MKNFKRILSSVLTAALCLGMMVPAMISCVTAASSNPLAGIDSKNYTKLNLSSQTDWKNATINGFIPDQEFVTHKGQQAVKLTFTDTMLKYGISTRWLITNGKKPIEHMLSFSIVNKSLLNREHKYAVLTYASNAYEMSDLYLMYWGDAPALLTNDLSTSVEYWDASSVVTLDEKFFNRAESGYLVIFSDDGMKSTDIYLKEMVMFANKEDAEKYAAAVPAAYNGETGGKPEIVYTEVPVASQDFENVTNIDELMIGSNIEGNVSIADDINGTNKRDPQTREVGGIPSIETDESGNSYLRVSRRIANAYGLGIPVASSNALSATGNGNYVLTFDMKPITTDTLLYNYPGAIKDSFFYEAPFQGDQVAFRIYLSGAANIAPLNGTAPGDLIGYTEATDGFTEGCHRMPEMDKWYKFYAEFSIEDPSKALTLNIWGGNWPIQNVDFAIDNIKLSTIVRDAGSVVAPPPEVVEQIPKGPATNIKAESYEVKGIMFNLDDSRFSDPNKANAAFLTKEDALTYVDQYIDCHITDLAFCVNTTFMSMYPSEVWEDQLDVYANGKGGASAVWYKYELLGIDPWQLWFERCWEKGVNPWISFRMNDTHGQGSAGSLASKSNNLIADWYWADATLRRINYHGSFTYRGDATANFNNDIIREKWLAYIEEAVNKYNVYGIELDWLRDEIFTTMGNEMADMELMTQFHRDIKAIVDKAEIKWGHEIKIGARVGRDIQTNIEMGFDIITYCAEGLLDVVIPCAYYMTDTEIPVQTWKKVLQSYDVELYPNASMGIISQCQGDRNGSDIIYYTHAYKSMSESLEIMAGTAASYYAQGADKVYLYNLFGDSANPIKAEHKIDTNVVDYPSGNNYARWNMQTTLGSPEKINTMTRRYVLTYQDYAGFFGTSHCQLPKTVSKVDRYAIVHFYTGDVQADDTVTLRLATKETNDLSTAMKIFVNGKQATLINRAAGNDRLTLDQIVYTFSVDKSVIKNSAMVEMTTTNEAMPYTVTYAELRFE